MYLVYKRQLKHLTKEQYLILRDLCHTAKNLKNQAIYEVLSYYEREKKYLSFFKVDKLLRDSPNYKKLSAGIAQQELRQVEYSFKSFFALLKIDPKVEKPRYLNKDGFAPLVVAQLYIKRGVFSLPYSISYKENHSTRILINIPDKLRNKNIKQIWIIPKQKARFFEVQFVYEQDEIQRDLDKTKALAIDLGVNNLFTCVTNTGDSFIVDGRYLKSVIQGYCKSSSKLFKIYNKQSCDMFTNRLASLVRKRNNRVIDYIHKVCKYVINYCLQNNIGILVCGMNSGIQIGCKLGKKNNQIFTQIPYYKILHNLEYLCKLNDITFIKQEESYTSKASFLDNDYIPYIGCDNVSFSGKRVKRGLYKSKNGTLINADVNGAFNILRKSNVVSIDALDSSGKLNVPVRIRFIKYKQTSYKSKI